MSAPKPVGPPGPPPVPVSAENATLPLAPGQRLLDVHFIEGKRHRDDGRTEYLVRCLKPDGAPYRSSRWMDAKDLDCPQKIAEYKAKRDGRVTNESAFSTLQHYAAASARVKDARFGPRDTTPNRTRKKTQHYKPSDYAGASAAAPGAAARTKPRAPPPPPPPVLSTSGGITKNTTRPRTWINLPTSGSRMLFEESGVLSVLVVHTDKDTARLSQQTVRQLLPYLKRFAEHGSLV